ncbi:unnamed protein product [Gongylonema pulchrum]|uniref:Uncharacterized protein n=1 Tax=Gongylonema pulchrum TaxID=637853 RepID=A0A183E6C8_9BILA|nr:unnamed protein product [Gongylonema pulchrum]
MLNCLLKAPTLLFPGRLIVQGGKTAAVLHGEQKRKLELQGIIGGAFRPHIRTMKGREVAPTFLASYARELKNGPSMLKILISRHIADLRAYQRARIEKIEKRLDNTHIINQIKVIFFP